MFSVPWSGSARKSFASPADGAAGLFFDCASQLATLMKIKFGPESEKIEAAEQTQKPPEGKGDLESVVSSKC
jgi:hypothetical protein